MMKFVFKDLEYSVFTRQLAEERLGNIVDKFPDLANHFITVTLGMENSPTQPGPDLFTVHLRVNGPKYRRVVIKKSSKSLFVALAELCEALLEVLNRSGDKGRVDKRAHARRFKKATSINIDNSPIL